MLSKWPQWTRRTPSDARLTSYLLGELSQNRRARLESRLLAEEDLFERLLLAEDDLIDAYADGTLPDERRRAFETRFASSREKREQVALSRGLRAAAQLSASTARAGEVSSPRWSLAEAVAALKHRALIPGVAVACLVLALMVWQQQPGEVVQPAGDSVARAILLPAVRSGAAERPRLEVTAATEAIELQIFVEGMEYYSSFRARFSTHQGKQIWDSGEIARADISIETSTLVLTLPGAATAAAIRQGRNLWMVSLEGVDLEGQRELIEEYELELGPGS